MICQKCGYENPGGDKICSKCNTLLDFHDIRADHIDTSGLAIENEESEKVSEDKAPKGKALLVVVALAVIAAVAAAIIVPQQLSKARAEGILEAITAARGSVEAHVKEHRVWPASENDLQPSLPAADVDIAIKKGVINLRIYEEPGKTAIISPSVENGRVVWQCESGGIGQQYLPLGCFK